MANEQSSPTQNVDASAAEHTQPARLRGQEELKQSVNEMIENFLSKLPAEQLLRHVPPEERLRGLPAEERLRGLEPDDLRRLPAAERQRLRELLELTEPEPRS